MRIAPSLRVALGSVVLLGAVRSQSFELDAVGGSMPGNINLSCHPASVPFELAVIWPSTQLQSTPCSLFDGLDPRSLSIGFELLGNMWAGFMNPTMDVGFPVPVLPSLQGQALYFQAVTFLWWQPTLFDDISNANAIWFANAGTFFDRGAVSFLYDRAFATVLPRSDHRWMLVGGGQGALLAQIARDTTEIYDPMTNSFSLGPMLTTARSMHTSTQLPNGTWLLTGGVNVQNDPQSSCEIYDPVLDTFTAVASMATPRMGHTATLLGNGKVLVTGGLAAMTVVPTQLSAVHDATNLTELYDPATNTWSAGPNLLTPRAGHFTLTRPDGKVVLGGGISWDPIPIIGWLPAVRRSCDLYDPVLNTMTAAAQMATARSLVDPVDLGSNRWLLAGGISSVTLASPGTPTAAAEIYDAVANTWTSVGSMATPRGNHKAWALGGSQFLLAGGANGTILSPVPLSSTEVFSTVTSSFTPGPAMTTARAGAAAWNTPQGQVQLFGGGTTGGLISRSTEWYYF